MGMVARGKEMARLGIFFQMFGGLFSFIGGLLILVGPKDICRMSGNYRPYNIYLVIIIFNLAVSLILGAYLLFDSEVLLSLSILELWVLFWVMVLVSGIMQFIAWRDMWKITRVHGFKTASTLMLAGAILFVIFIGVILIIIATIVLFIAFGEIPNLYYVRSEGGDFLKDLVDDEQDTDAPENTPIESQAEVLAENF